ncbi:hypothetical protein PK28_12480 [Hymenobacter sp. DG25B]|uniref:hypothetical protein n=1 Tax=Hymenobacter sp. DG25B TaxID=1385664 RepID=UPI00054081B4|nr:hypothetical protein [Hymenobacter sp. DG25B]AIZ64295.1 hypothetical protein PK28_12480 [Hymenobacter sp. DG25B]
MQLPFFKLRSLLLLTGVLHFQSLTAFSQEIDVENEQFRGAKRVRVESFNQGPAGFWAEYKLDEQGRATEGRSYYRRQHLSTEQYFFTRRNKLQQERITKSGKDPQTQTFSYTYFYNTDSTRLLHKVGLSGTDTMYVFHYLEFDANNHPTKFTKAKGWSRKVDSLTETIYAAELLTSYLNTENGEKGPNITSLVYQYDAHGGLTKVSPMPSPTDPAIFWTESFLGNELKFEYGYSPKGPWTHLYQIFDGKRVLIEKRTFTY